VSGHSGIKLNDHTLKHAPVTLYHTILRMQNRIYIMKHRQLLAGITAASVVFLGASLLLDRLRFLYHVVGVPKNNQGLTGTFHLPSNMVMASTNVSLARPIILAPYTIKDLVEISSIFFKTFGILVYDPMSNDFLLLYNYQKHIWRASCSKLVSSFQALTDLLRKDFPERFRGPESPELGKSSDFDVLMKCNVTTLK
jgi:hypothetical protein